MIVGDGTGVVEDVAALVPDQDRKIVRALECVDVGERMNLVTKIVRLQFAQSLRLIHERVS